jgi:penicillin-binding protein 1A
MPLASASNAGRRGLNPHDVVFVKVGDANSRQAPGGACACARAFKAPRSSSTTSTGAILAMAGGFSYPLSQFNRVTQAQRQPGSSLKPFTYLAALRNGLQPNTLVRDSTLTLPPIGNPVNAREKDYWTPKDYDAGGGGIMTLRHGLENSVNLVTANLLDGGIDSDPRQSLARVCELTVDAQVYRECSPIILSSSAPSRRG